MSYNKTVWKTKDIVKADLLNKIENGIYENSVNTSQNSSDITELNNILTDLDDWRASISSASFNHVKTVAANASYGWATPAIPEGATVKFTNNGPMALTLNVQDASGSNEKGIASNVKTGESVTFTAPYTIGYMRSWVGNGTEYNVTVEYGLYKFEVLEAETKNAVTSVEQLESKYKTVIGKNLFNKDDPENLYGTSKSDCYTMDDHGVPVRNTVADANYSVSCLVPVESGKTVYFGFVDGTYKQTYVYQIALFDSSKQFVSLHTWVGSYTIPSGIAFIRVSAVKLPNQFQIEYDARTSYEAYSKTTYLNGVKVNEVDVVGGGEDYLVLPKKFYGVQNKEYDIFFKNIIVGNFNRFIVGKSGAGEQLSRRIKYNVGTAGTTNTNLVLYDESYNQIQSANISYVNANASAHSGKTLKVLVIGDSFINSGYVTNGLIRDFENDVASIQLLGTLGTAPNLHEGRSGWSSYEYTHETAVGSVSNPFLNNGAFDFSHYISANSVAKPDYVIINLGINDGWKDMHGTTTAENLQVMIDSIHAYDSAIKVIVGTTPSPYLGDGENGYLAHLLTNRGRQNLTKNVLENLAESETVIICPTHLNFDTDYNFNMTTITKNGENDGTVPYCSDDTHPSHMGFYQIADSYYACIKAN